jgi:hypothetical protein
LITEETPEASLLAVSRVSEEVPMALTPAGADSTVAVVFTVVAALMAAVEGIGDSHIHVFGIRQNSRMEEVQCYVGSQF